MFYGKLLLSGILTNWTGISIGKEKAKFCSSSVKKVARHPITSIPFIPASSFRGAIRKILEKETEHFFSHKTQEEYEECNLCQIFGIPEQEAQKLSFSQPGRAIVRDIFLTQESELFLLQQIQFSDITEIKVYRKMDRITAQGEPYAIEQIPAGCHFHFDFLFTLYEKKDIRYFEKFLECLLALESSSLGGSSSRGLGRIRFGEWTIQESFCHSGVSLTWHPKAYYEKGEGEISLFSAQENKGIQEILGELGKIKSAIL